MTQLLPHLIMPLIISHSGLQNLCSWYNIINNHPCVYSSSIQLCWRLTYCWSCCIAESEGRGSTLDTLPEDRSTNTQYRRVYSDWRPTIDKTDVVGAMEAIEGRFCTTSHDCSDQLVGAAGQTATSVSLSVRSMWKHFHDENQQVHIYSACPRTICRYTCSGNVAFFLNGYFQTVD